MNSKRIKILLTGVGAWISLLLMITTTYSASIVIGGNYTDIGTIIFVSPKPGDTPATAGTALLNTLNGISDNSATNPYLIKVGPGIYDLGTGSLQMKSNVDVDGSGENTTIITGHINSVSAGVVNGASYAEIRFLTVQNAGGATNALAIYNNSASPKITNVTAFASGGTQGIGVYNSSSFPTMTNVTVSASGGTQGVGVYNTSSSPTMTNVTVSASGGTNNYGVYNSSSSPTMTNVTASASGGDINFGVYGTNTGTTTIHNSVIIGSTNTIYNWANTTIRVANSKLVGGAVYNASGSTLTCAGVYDENYTFHASTCP